jgi:hypothetical protein
MGHVVLHDIDSSRIPQPIILVFRLQLVNLIFFYSQ